MQTAVVAADRLGEILDLEAEKQENEQRKMAPESLAGDIKFEPVNFRYGTRQRVLEDIDFTIKRAKNCLCWRKRFRKNNIIETAFALISGRVR